MNIYHGQTIINHRTGEMSSGEITHTYGTEATAKLNGGGSMWVQPATEMDLDFANRYFYKTGYRGNLGCGIEADARVPGFWITVD